MLDLRIRDALIADGTGHPAVRGDVGIQGGRISAIGNLDSVEAARCIDANGEVLAPGFIDMHSHADFTLHLLPTADSLVQQGITTSVVGQCGISTAPVSARHREEVVAANQMIRGFDGRWSTLGEYLREIRETGSSLNLVPVVGQGTIRLSVMGMQAGEADASQIRRMQREIERAMGDGAIGISTGLTYVPGCFSGMNELVSTFAPLEGKGLYFTHMRGSGGKLLDAVSEAIEIGRRASMSVELSHFKAAGRQNWEKADAAFELVESARSSGLDISCDMYVYTAGSTSLLATLPDWAQEGPAHVVLARLGDPALRRQMSREMNTSTSYKHLEWDQVLITYAQDPEWEGRTVAALADSVGLDPYTWVLDALLSSKLAGQIAMFMMSDENIEMQLAKPYMMIGSDGWGLSTKGPLSRGKPHPRCYGTYPRLIGKYVRETHVLTLEDAIRKATGAPAEKLGLRDRGLVKTGYWADLVLFDPLEIRDTATYEAPHRYPEGIRCVIVNGDVVVEHGVHTGICPGRIIGR